MNKSASIFLGSNSKTTHAVRPGSLTATSKATQSDTVLLRRKESKENISDGQNIPDQNSTASTGKYHRAPDQIGRWQLLVVDTETNNLQYQT